MCIWQEQLPRLQISELAQANVLICQEESEHKGFTSRMLQSLQHVLANFASSSRKTFVEWVCSVLKFNLVFVSIARYSVVI